MARDHRDEARGTHFHGFLRHVVEPRLFERRKQQMQVARLRLRPRHFDELELCRALSLPGEAREPFTVASVEDAQAGAIPEAQHMAQVVGLLPRKLEPQRPRARSLSTKSLHAAKSCLVMSFPIMRLCRWRRALRHGDRSNRKQVLPDAGDLRAFGTARPREAGRTRADRGRPRSIPPSIVPFFPARPTRRARFRPDFPSIEVALQRRRRY